MPLCKARKRPGHIFAVKGGDPMLSQIWVRRYTVLAFLLALAAVGADHTIGP
jgi:hypothetical protein